MKKLIFDEELVITQYYAFRSSTEVAKIYGCSDQTIIRVLQRNGIDRVGWKVPERKPSRKYAPLDDAERQRIIDEYIRCGKMRDVAVITNHSQNTVSKVIHNANIEIAVPGQKITDDEILADIAEGLTRQEIADRHGVHVENLARRMHRLGVHARYAPPISKSGTIGKPFEKQPLSDVWHWSDDGKAFVDKHYLGQYEYIEQRQRRFRIKCKTCGEILDRERSSIRTKAVCCDKCKEQERNQKELQDKRIELMRFFYAIKEFKTPKVCAKCGDTFYSQYPNAKYCSKTCKQKAKRKQNNYRERCRKYGVYYDPSVSRDKVIERDDGICQICGIKCNPNDKSWGSSGATYPTLDHIIPLAKGGTHTWDNVQCACGLCNSNKRDIV